MYRTSIIHGVDEVDPQSTYIDFIHHTIHESMSQSPKHVYVYVYIYMHVYLCLHIYVCPRNCRLKECRFPTTTLQSNCGNLMYYKT